MLATFAFDVFAEAKMPCIVREFTFFNRIQIAIAAPVVLIVVCLIGGVCWSLRKRQRLHAGKVPL